MKTVRVVSDSGIGRGTTVTDVETGTPIHGITSVAIAEFGPSDLVKVSIEIGGAYLDLKGGAVFRVTDPRDGVLRDVAKIVWADGTPDFDAETGL